MQQRVQALRSSVRRNEHKKVNDTKVRFWNNSGFDENSDTVAIYSVEDWRMLTKEELILLLKFCSGLWRNSIVKPDQGIRSQVGPLLPCHSSSQADDKMRVACHTKSKNWSLIRGSQITLYISSRMSRRIGHYWSCNQHWSIPCYAHAEHDELTHLCSSLCLKFAHEYSRTMKPKFSAESE